MGEKLIKPYEISVWEDKLVVEYEQLPAGSQEQPKVINTYYEEKKIAVIGSNTMVGYNKVYEPVFTKKTNGEKTLTFSLKYQYFDPYIGATVNNPFASYLINERKVKLKYDNQWYDFIIKEHTESSDGLVWKYTATDAFINELSKNGYSKEFDVELGNNQGTAIELAKVVVDGTDWTVDETNSSVGPQEISEAIYNATLVSNGVTIVNAETGEEIHNIASNTSIYLFYNYVANKDGNFVQFILQEDNPNNYVLDDNNTIKATNYRITTPLVYDEENSRFVFTNDPTNLTNATPIITFTNIEVSYQAYRKVYGHLSTYDPIMQRIVNRYKLEGLQSEIYNYTDYIYSTSDVVVNYITNGDNFNIYDNGTLQGWNEPVESTVTQDEQTIYATTQLVTYPSIEAQSPLKSLTSYSQIEGYMEVKFPGAFNDYRNGIFNSGIEDSASILQSISAGQEYIFRWRGAKSSTQHGSLSALGANDLRVVVAKYKKSSVSDNNYYNIVDKNNIILDFNPINVPGQKLNNYIKGGILSSDSKAYLVDGIPQEPSTKYIYQYNNTDYVWDSRDATNLRYVPKNSNNAPQFFDYYYMIATAKRSVTAADLADSTMNYGVFIYAASNANQYYYLQDIQLTKLYYDGATPPQILTIGSAPTATALPIDYFYIKPDKNTTKEQVAIYTSMEALANELGTDKNLIKPIYNENATKYLSINESHSNCYNLLQTIAETFECWVDIVVKHSNEGYITYSYRKTLDTTINSTKAYYVRSGSGTIQNPYNYSWVKNPVVSNISNYYEYKPDKYICLREYAGKDNFAGFKYGINLDTIERTVNSDEIVTKLVVTPAHSDYAEEGSVAIGYASANPSGEEYILNFDYYYKQGLITNVDDARGDVNKFNELLRDINNKIVSNEKQRRNLEQSLVALNSQRNTYSSLIDEAKNNVNEGKNDFKSLTGHNYDDYRNDKTSQIVDLYYFLSEDTEVYAHKDYYSRNGNKYTLIANPEGNPHSQNYYEYLADLESNHTITDLIASIYSNSYVINNYAGILTNVEQEYKKVRKALRGSEEFTITVGLQLPPGSSLYRLKVNISDYINFSFYTANVKYTTDVNTKSFEISTNAPNMTSLVYSNDYDLVDYRGQKVTSIIPTTDKIQVFTLKPKAVFDGIEDKIDKFIKQKEELVELFYNKYNRFIQEGTWSSTDYIDSNLYYLDALQISNTSAQPQVTYSIKVVEVSELEGLEWYLFDVGDKTYIEDTEFFGWDEIGGISTPAREEVIVSEVEWHLEEPENNIITVQNYKTRFEDLFQRMSATVQTVQYNEATYAKTSSLMDAYGTISQSVLLESLNNISGQSYALTSDGSIIIDGDAITIIDLHNKANLMRLESTGLRISSDGGKTWATAISGRGINIKEGYYGMLNTDKIIIGSKDNPSFRWDQAGISAYKRDRTNNVYDLTTYVRFDQYGLYGIDRDKNFQAANLNEVKDKASFAITWDGFFIRNKYTNGRVEITSTDDFRVIQTYNNQDHERIKIGALEFNSNGQPTKYGIRIKNTDGQNVFVTDDRGDVTITGTINALAGDFSGQVIVGHQNPHIIIDGESASIKTSDYSDGASPGWKIDGNGDAVFNNITARGAIKTAVFEYAEIQAVGGLFIFRPSSVIKQAQVAGNDLIVTVENPRLFRIGSYCKVSNYITHGDDFDAAAVLGNNGLTHVYKVINMEQGYVGPDSTGKLGELTLGQSTLGSRKNITTALIRLENAAQMVVGNEAVTTCEKLIGGALVDMGLASTDSGYENGVHNYGIGINSSDNVVDLPQRALSLFETKINPNNSIKVTYDFKGILGTLPDLSSAYASQKEYKYLKGTQGIFTNNMYIGDANQYLTFYTDTDDLDPRTNKPKKKLRIVADEIFYKVKDSESDYHQVSEIEIEQGAQGPPGASALQISVLSTFGTSIRSSNTNGIGAMYATITKDGLEIDSIGNNLQAVASASEIDNPVNGQRCIVVDSTTKTAIPYEYNSSVPGWTRILPNSQITYEWTFRDKNNTPVTIPGVQVNNKCLYVSADMVDKKLTAEVKITVNS